MGTDLKVSMKCNERNVKYFMKNKKVIAIGHSSSNKCVIYT